jgi:hypothetical protein
MAIRRTFHGFCSDVCAVVGKVSVTSLLHYVTRYFLVPVSGNVTFEERVICYCNGTVISGSGFQVSCYLPC